MLSIPGIKEFIRTRDGRKQSSEIDLATLLDSAHCYGIEPNSYAPWLAAHLDIEILAVMEFEPGGQAGKLTVANVSGVVCDATIPSLEDRGAISKLVAKREPASGRAKIFARDEVFPCDGSWCDVVPLDSTVSYVFVPVCQLPAVGDPPAESDSGTVSRFVIAAETGSHEGQGLALKALTCASLIALSLVRREVLKTRTSIAPSRGFPRDRGDSLSETESTAGMAESEASQSPKQHPGVNGRSEKLRMLSRFMSSIAHEIKNPLTGIAAGVQYLSKKLQPGLAEDETVEFILTEINRLNRIVDDLYKIAKPPELVLGPVNINDVVAKSLLCLSESILKKRLSLSQHLGDEVPEIEADPDRLQQVLINIIKNAVEVSPEKGVLRIETTKSDTHVAILVIDSGPGIPPAERDKIFEPFYSTKAGGSGLGLCISQRIMDEHGGRILIETPEAGGTSFGIELPLRGEHGNRTGS